MTTPAFYRTVARTGHQTDQSVVKRATAAVLHALRDRLTVAVVAAVGKWAVHRRLSSATG